MTEMLAIDFGGSKVALGIVSAAGDVRERQRFAIDPTMHAQIAEQPAVLQGMLDRLPSFAHDLSSMLPERPRGVVLVASGSSRHAATYWR